MFYCWLWYQSLRVSSFVYWVKSISCTCLTVQLSWVLGGAFYGVWSLLAHQTASLILYIFQRFKCRTLLMVMVQCSWIFKTAKNIMSAGSLSLALARELLCSRTSVNFVNFIASSLPHVVLSGFWWTSLNFPQSLGMAGLQKPFKTGKIH